MVPELRELMAQGGRTEDILCQGSHAGHVRPEEDMPPGFSLEGQTTVEEVLEVGSVQE